MPEIQNPNLQSQGSGGGGGGDMRSTMAFMLLAMAVFFGYQFFFMKPKTDQQPPAQTQSQATAPAAPTASANPAAPGQTPNGAAPAQAPTATPQISASLETYTTVENEFYKIVFSNRGAQVKNWILKKYFDSAGKPLDLVQPQAAARFGLPLSLFTYEPALTTELNGALYKVSYGGAQPSATGLLLAPTAITFEYSANGVDAVKTFRFDSSYVIGVESKVTRNGVPLRTLVEWPAGLGDMEELHQTSMLRGQMPTPSFFAWSIENRDDVQAAAKVSGNNTLQGSYQYAAVMDLYFAAAFLPDAPDRTTVVTLHNSIDLPADPSDPNSKKASVDVLGLAVGDTSGDTRLRLFTGPKATEILSSIYATGPDGKPDGPSLHPLIQFGSWLGYIAKPLYLALRFIHNSIGAGAYSWGWAIILFTAVFNIAFIPLRFMMMKSSLKMMRIQPKVDAIKKRYANLKMNDPKKTEMNTEIMALYKEENVNMYGSCLPMLPQLPLFYGFFRVLYNAVELRQAHWFWLPDLSQPDPIHILPILIIISMFLTQYITPSPGMDPMQRRMMAFILPIFMGSFLWHYASGLALYWATGNVLNLALQVFINQSSYGKEMHAIAARRAAKKAGVNPKTIQGKR
ncbi:MAG: membrane protein insertase YidC [Terracidiphilus sp.]|nr:membrane protein insertase YidC [Terracidiphilus sp.]